MMHRSKTWVLMALVAVIGCAATPTKGKGKLPAQDTAAAREQVMGAMQSELDRSVKLLKFKDYVSPYFIGYQLRELEELQITGKYGGIVTGPAWHLFKHNARAGGSLGQPPDPVGIHRGRRGGELR